MSVITWVIVHFLGVLFWLWIVRWGGAGWLEGTFAAGLLIHCFAPRWTAEGIKLFGWGTLIGSVIWFFIGLFIPAARFYW